VDIWLVGEEHLVKTQLRQKTKNDFAELRLRTTSMFSIGQTNKQAGGQWPGGWNLPFDHFPI